MYCTLSVTAVQMEGGWRASRELCWRWLVAVLGPQQKQVDRGTPSIPPVSMSTLSTAAATSIRHAGEKCANTGLNSLWY